MAVLAWTGLLLGTLIKRELAVALLQAVANGVILYVGTMICLPVNFVSGNRWTAYACSLLGFILTLMYFPVCVILRV